LTMKISILRQFLSKAADRVQRHSLSEIRTVATVNVAKMQEELDVLSKELRELNARIQCLNWTVDIDI